VFYLRRECGDVRTRNKHCEAEKSNYQINDCTYSAGRVSDLYLSDIVSLFDNQLIHFFEASKAPVTYIDLALDAFFFLLLRIINATVRSQVSSAINFSARYA
jgi:hypothetical protein